MLKQKKDNIFKIVLCPCWIYREHLIRHLKIMHTKWIYYRTNNTTEVLVYIYITTNKILGNILMHYPMYIDICAYIESLDNIPSEVQILKIEL